MKQYVRLYGKTVNTWMTTEQFTDQDGKQRERKIITQYEVEFTEYNQDGSIARKGTEDFSRERYGTIANKWVFTWDGQKLNKGGKRWFEDRGMIKFNSFQNKEVKKLLESKFPTATLIQLR